jgi:hypothetical protein
MAIRFCSGVSRETVRCGIGGDQSFGDKKLY